MNIQTNLLGRKVEVVRTRDDGGNYCGDRITTGEICGVFLNAQRNSTLNFLVAEPDGLRIRLIQEVKLI